MHLYKLLPLYSHWNTPTSFSPQEAILRKYWHIPSARSTRYMSRCKYQIKEQRIIRYVAGFGDWFVLCCFEFFFSFHTFFCWGSLGYFFFVWFDFLWLCSSEFVNLCCDFGYRVCFPFRLFSRVFPCCCCCCCCCCC